MFLLMSIPKQQNVLRGYWTKRYIFNDWLAIEIVLDRKEDQAVAFGIGAVRLRETWKPRSPDMGGTRHEIFIKVRRILFKKKEDYW